MVQVIKILGCRFTLEPHSIEEQPASKAQEVAYVGFAGTAVLKAAIWKRGKWVDHRGRDFDLVPACWYSIEGPHVQAPA